MSAPAHGALRVGISECLLGRAVRYDGRHKRQPWLAELEAAGVEWSPVCPEVQIGLGVPRPPIVLVQVGEAVRLRTLEGAGGASPGPDYTARSHAGHARDHTLAMTEFAAACVERLSSLGLDGYILKSKSPSCGLDGVPILDATGRAVARGAGLFAAALRAAWPELLVVEEQVLAEPGARQAFLEQLRSAARARRSEP